MFIAALFPIARMWKQAKRPSAGTGYGTSPLGGLLSHIKEQTVPFAAMWMDLKTVTD